MSINQEEIYLFSCSSCARATNLTHLSPGSAMTLYPSGLAPAGQKNERDHLVPKVNSYGYSQLLCPRILRSSRQGSFQNLSCRLFTSEQTLSLSSVLEHKNSPPIAQLSPYGSQIAKKWFAEEPPLPLADGLRKVRSSTWIFK